MTAVWVSDLVGFDGITPIACHFKHEILLVSTSTMLLLDPELISAVHLRLDSSLTGICLAHLRSLTQVAARVRWNSPYSAVLDALKGACFTFDLICHLHNASSILEELLLTLCPICLLVLL